MNTTTASAKVYRVTGTTDDVTTCGLCGREELKGTVVLEHLEDGATVYAGSDCGRRAAGWTAKEMTARVSEAVNAARQAEEAAWRADRDAENRAFCAWVFTTYGLTITQPADLNVPGETPFMIRKRYRAETGRR